MHGQVLHQISHVAGHSTFFAYIASHTILLKWSPFLVAFFNQFENTQLHTTQIHLNPVCGHTHKTSLVTTNIIFLHATITCNITANHRQHYQILITWSTSWGPKLGTERRGLFWYLVLPKHFGRCHKEPEVQYPALHTSVNFISLSK